jgi:hypothetical protein
MVNKKNSFDFDRTIDVPVVISASDHTDTEGVPVFDWTTPGDFMSPPGLIQRGWRPNIGNQGGFHVIDRFAIFGVLATCPEDRDHDRLKP